MICMRIKRLKIRFSTVLQSSQRRPVDKLAFFSVFQNVIPNNILFQHAENFMDRIEIEIILLIALMLQF